MQMKPTSRKARAAQQQEMKHGLIPRSIALFLVLCAAIIFTFLLINFDVVKDFFGNIATAIGPVFYGIIFAYLLNPICRFIENRFLKLAKNSKDPERTAKNIRGLSAILTVLLAIAVLALLCVIIVPAVWESIAKIAMDLPNLIQSFINRTEKFLKGNPMLSNALNSATANLETLSGDEILSQANVWMGYLANGLVGVFNFAYNVIIGLIISVYLLMGKERFLRQGAKLLYATMKQHRAEWILRRLRNANHTFSSAILGKMLDSFIIGMLCFIGVVIMDMPYPSLIAVIVGVTNMLPFFGPFIGAIPSTLLVLMHSTEKAIYFAIFILILQQFDCNILDPKIVGGSIGLPAFWDLFACLLGGGLFGLFGMLIGVPAFAVFYQLVKELVEEKLRRRQLSDHLLKRLGIKPGIDPNDLFFDVDEPPEPIDTE